MKLLLTSLLAFVAFTLAPSTGATTTPSLANDTNVSLGSPHADYFDDDTAIIAAYTTDKQQLHTPEEEEYEGYCLVKSFQATHARCFYDSDSGLLGSVTFTGEIYAKNPNYHPNNHNNNPLFPSYDWINGGCSNFWINFAKYWLPSGCRELLEALTVQQDVPTGGVRGGKKGQTPHEAWELEFCACLKKGGKKFDYHVVDCSILVMPKEDAENFDPSGSGSGSDNGDDSNGDQINDDSVVVVAFETNAEQCHNAAEQDYEGSCIVQSFHVAYPNSGTLGSLLFGGEMHKKNPKNSHNHNNNPLFPSYSWINGGCWSPSGRRELLEALKEQDAPAGWVLGSKRGQTPHETWELEFCACLKKGGKSFDYPVSNCKIAVMPKKNDEAALSAF